MNRRLLPWAPAIAVPVVVVIGSLVVPLQASAAVDLPDKTPQQVLEMIGDSSVTAFSGTIEQKSELGLPDLSAAAGPGAPSDGGSGSEAPDITSMLDLVTGSHTARVYVDGDDRSRMQVLDAMAERDVIRNGSDVWLFDSEAASAAHITLPAADGEHATRLPGESTTPAAMADELLKRLDPTTGISVSDDVSVAGRDAYTLVLAPDDDDTLIESAALAVDAETGLPLSVTVLARGQSAPAFSVAFTSVEFSTPSADLFSFTPPEGTTVTEEQLPGSPTDRSAAPDADFAGPTVIGSGWSAVVELPADSVPTDLAASPLFAAATETVQGGRVLSTALATVLFTDDGRVFAGSVLVDRLLDASAG